MSDHISLAYLRKGLFSALLFNNKAFNWIADEYLNWLACFVLEVSYFVHVAEQTLIVAPVY